MLPAITPYIHINSRRRKRRQNMKSACADVLNQIEIETTSSEEEISKIIDSGHDNSFPGEKDTTNLFTSNDEVDMIHSLVSDESNDENINPIVMDISNNLYDGCRVSTKKAALDIMAFSSEFHLSKFAVERLLALIKSLLPVQNSLPSTTASMMKLIGVNGSSLTKFYCNACGDLCFVRSRRRYCENTMCQLYNRSLNNRSISEVVTLDIREQLQSILERNSAMLDDPDKFDYFDIKSGTYYRETVKSVQKKYQGSSGNIEIITLNIHTDGAPLVRTTKSCLWPCLASIVELPHQIRESQTNLVVLCLWVASVKPNISMLVDDSIKQILNLSKPFTLIINNEQRRFVLRTQFFVSDLPAKALFWKTINFNGYSACSYCMTEGNCRNRQVLYPYDKNSFEHRTHSQFVKAAQTAESRSSGRKRACAVNGVKGVSPLLQIFEYPKQVILDYMHLCCLGHMSTLIQRWTTMIEHNEIKQIDSLLSSQKFPHNVHVRFNFSVMAANDWKAKHFRVILLSIGLPIFYRFLPPPIVSHFALYTMFIKLLHCPLSMNEIVMADKIIHCYCQNARQVYDETIELYSLHAHLHLPQQVFTHGGLAYTSAFCFESSIRYLKKKAHGTRDLGGQISDWVQAESALSRTTVKSWLSVGLNYINIDNRLFSSYRSRLLNLLNNRNIDENQVMLFLRCQIKGIIYHTTLYDFSFNCSSHTVSFKTIASSSIQYGKVVVFLQIKQDFYAMVNHFTTKGKTMSDIVSVPQDFKSKLDEIFPVRQSSEIYGLVPVTDFLHKCIEVHIDNDIFLSEIRTDFEHD